MVRVGVRVMTREEANGTSVLRESAEVLRELTNKIDSVYLYAKLGVLEGVYFENLPRYTAEGPALDCGIVTGDGFSIEKIDLYGDNPMYNYTDEGGSIFLQSICLANSTIKVGDESLIAGNDLLRNPDALKYVESVSQRMKEVGEKVKNRK